MIDCIIIIRFIEESETSDNFISTIACQSFQYQTDSYSKYYIIVNKINSYNLVCIYTCNVLWRLY